MMHFQHHQCWPIATTNRLATNPTSSDYYYPTIAARIVVLGIITGKVNVKVVNIKTVGRAFNLGNNVFFSPVTHILDIICFFM